MFIYLLQIPLRFYFLSKPIFPISESPRGGSPIENVCDLSFFKRTTKRTLEAYNIAISEAATQFHPVVRVLDTGKALIFLLFDLLIVSCCAHLCEAVMN